MDPDVDFRLIWNKYAQQDERSHVACRSCEIRVSFSRKVEQLVFKPLGAAPQQQALEAAKYKVTELFHRTRRAPGNQEQHVACLVAAYIEAYDRADELLLLWFPPSLEPPVEAKAPKPPRKPRPGRVLFGEVE